MYASKKEKKVYKSLQLSLLTYAAPAWQPLAASLRLEQLESCQNKALRVVTGQLKYTPNERVRGVAGICSIATAMSPYIISEHESEASLFEGRVLWIHAWLMQYYIPYFPEDGTWLQNILPGRKQNIRWRNDFIANSSLGNIFFKKALTKRGFNHLSNFFSDFTGFWMIRYVQVLYNDVKYNVKISGPRVAFHHSL